MVVINYQLPECKPAECGLQSDHLKKMPVWSSLVPEVLCPGTTKIVTQYLGVSNFQRAILIVIPLSCSAFSLLRTQAYSEGTLARLLGFLLEHLNCFFFIKTSTLVDQVVCSGELATVYITNYNNVDMSLLTSHLGSSTIKSLLSICWKHAHASCENKIKLIQHNNNACKF